MINAMKPRQLLAPDGRVVATDVWLKAAATATAAPLCRRSAFARLMAGIALGAAALALSTNPQAAQAQAVQGTATVQFGANAPIYDAVTKTDTVFVNASEALIDWAITSPTGTFLPEGSTLSFVADSSGPYTVLNRVSSSTTAGPLSISGTVESGSQGRIWFYNPGGWVAGATGVFNVGSLVLTSLPITVDPASDTVSRLLGDKGEIRFGKATVPTSSVTIESGARIDAILQQGSYVALVAPRVSQGGTVQVNGSAAYVGAEAATLTINNGLFDIVVDSGTDDSIGVSHTGTTTGPAGTSNDPYHRIHLVAVPKNQAMTAIVSGSLGYKAADTAQGEADGSIILSAGFNVGGGSPLAGANAGGNAGLTLTDLSASNVLSGYAGSTVAIDAKASDVTFDAAANFYAQGDVRIDVDNAHALTASGGLDVLATNASVAGTARSGDIALTASNGSTVQIGGVLNLVSSAEAVIRTDPDNGDVLAAGGIGDDAIAGNVSVNISDSNFSAGDTYLASNAIGGVGELSYGNATAGDATFTAVQTEGNASTRSVSVANLSVQSLAFENYFSSFQIPVGGGEAASGNVGLSVDGGIFAATSAVSASSEASATGGSDGLAQDATAGSATIAFANGADRFDTGRVNLSNYASASGGGAVTLGDVGLSYDAVDSTTRDGSIFLSSNAYGELTAPNTISLSLTNGSRLDTVGSLVYLSSTGRSETGRARSGNISLLLDDSTLLAAQVYGSSDVRGNASGVDALGGSVSATLRNGASLVSDSEVNLTSDAEGGSGSGSGSGDGRGGAVSLDLSDSSLSTFYLYLQSTGVAGTRFDASGTRGIGTGGNVSFLQQGTEASVTAEIVSIGNVGLGGRPNEGSRNDTGRQAGNAADGVGGSASFGIAGGTFDAASVTVSATGEGGSSYNVEGAAPGRGGAGIGGTATLAISGGAARIGTLDIIASGTGGDGANQDEGLGIAAGVGGAGAGGSALATITGGSLLSDVITIEANGNKSVDAGNGFFSYFGNGGASQVADGTGGTGGRGNGGTAQLTIDGGNLASNGGTGLPLTVAVNAIGEGGAGGYSRPFSGAPGDSGSGGNGIGGVAGISFLAGQFDAADIRVDASGLGGLGGNTAYFPLVSLRSGAAGASGTGGSASLVLGTDFDALTSGDDSRDIRLTADGIGRNGESGAVGGSGGSGRGGSVAVTSLGGNAQLVSSQLSAVGTGGRGGNSGNDANGGAGGSGTGGSVALLADGASADLTASGTVVSLNAAGGVGGRGGNGSTTLDAAGNGGAGGSGTGGNLSFAATDSGTLTIESLSGLSTFSAIGTGATGGMGGNAAASGFGSTGNGGAGGAGNGGKIAASADAGGRIDLGTILLEATGRGGAGGALSVVEGSLPLEASIGGAGGAGTGGNITLTATGDGTVTATGLSAFTLGYGGGGVNGSGYDLADGTGAAGSAGGDASAGAIAVLAEQGGAISIAPGNGDAQFIARAFGGSGGRGATGRAGTGGNGGIGGQGGQADGGSVTITSRTEGEIDIRPGGTTLVEASGYGGFGGRGGVGGNNVANGGTGGNGGDSGTSAPGVGGEASFAAVGGDLTLGDLAVTARGVTNVELNVAGPGSGPGGDGLQGQRSYAVPFGGDVSIASSDDATGNPGSLIAGLTTITVTSEVAFPSFSLAGVAGSVSVQATSALAADALHFASLSVDASGTAVGGTGIVIGARSGPMEVDTDLTLVSAGPISVTADGAGSVLVGNLADIASDASIAITGIAGGQLRAASVQLLALGSITVESADCTETMCSPVHAQDFFVANASGQFNLIGPAVVAGLGSVDVYAFGNITGDAGSGYFSNGNVQVRGGNDVSVRNATGADITIGAGAVIDGETFYYPGTLTLGEVSGRGQFTASGDMTFASGGGIAVTDGNTFEAERGISFTSGNDILVGGQNRISANLVGPNSARDVTFDAGGLNVDYTLAPDDIATLGFGGGTSVEANGGAIRLLGAAIDARGASFSGASIRVDVSRLLAASDPRRNDGGRLDPECLEGAICLGAIDVSGAVEIGHVTRPLDVRLSDGISGQTISVTATGDIVLGGGEVGPALDAAGAIALTSLQGGIALESGSSVRGGTVALSGAGSLTGTGVIEATTDDVGLSFGGDIDAGAIIAARELTSASAVGGSIEGLFSTPGSLRIGALTLGSDARIGAGVDIAVGTLDLGGHSGSLDAGNALDLTSTGDIANLALTAATIGFGTLDVSGDLALSASAITGTSAIAGGTLDVTADGLTASLLRSAGNLVVTVADTASLGSVESTAGSVLVDPILLTFDAISAAGSISLAGGTITGGTVDAGTSLTIDATGALTLASARAGSTMTLAAGSLTVPSLVATGNLSLTVAGQSTLGTATAGQALTIDSADVSFEALSGGSVAIVASSVLGGPIQGTASVVLSGESFDIGDVITSGSISLTASGSARFGRLDAVRDVGIAAGLLSGTAITAGADIAIDSDGDVALAQITGGAMRIFAGGIVDLPSLSATGTVTVVADDVRIATSGALAISRIDAVDGNVDIAAARSITGQVVNARGDISLVSSRGDVAISHLSAGYADVFSEAVRPQANGPAGAVGPGDISIDAGGDIRIDTLADAANAFTANAGEIIRLNGLATGRTMALSSQDIVIAAGGQLGEAAHTTTIALGNNGTGVILLGDGLTGQAGAYALDNAEFSRIQSAGDLSLTGPGDMFVGKLDVAAQSGSVAGQIGEAGGLTLQAGGKVSVLGALAMTGAKGNTLDITGAGPFFLDAASGSIRLTDGQDRAGSLQISASSIAMVTTSAQQAIAGLTDTASITARLSDNDGVAAGRTLVEAGAVELRSDRAVYIQNTATGAAFDDRRGLIADTLAIDSRDGGTLDIAINGIVGGKIGIEAIGVTDFVERFTSLSSMNGCVIAAVGSCAAVPPPEPETPVIDVIETRDVIAEVLGSNPANNALLVLDSFVETSLIQLNRIAPAGFEPLIDEPVTGTGNDDLIGDEDLNEDDTPGGE